jgi:hypothetical protein
MSARNFDCLPGNISLPKFTVCFAGELWSTLMSPAWLVYSLQGTRQASSNQPSFLTMLSNGESGIQN